MITAEYAKELLTYDPKTGILRWRMDRGRNGKVKAGDIAGTRELSESRYFAIKIDNVLYKNHRLAWLITYGYMPKCIDHIDGDTGNNRLANLRECTMTQNKGNSRSYKNNTSGVKGVHQVRGRWRSYVQCGRKRVHIGYFDTKEEAAAAYIKKAKELFGEFARAA